LSGADWRPLRAWRDRARALRQDVVAVARALRDPRVPWYAKAVGACVVAYAVSPIDLIPDFIPVLGLLDDLVLVPLGIMLVVRLIPADILAEHRAAAAPVTGLPASRAAAVAIVAVWVLTAAAVTALLVRGLGVTIIVPGGGPAPP
jgi:uncharacterized membrane protein YkvA (DUF1232 family)